MNRFLCAALAAMLLAPVSWAMVVRDGGGTSTLQSSCPSNLFIHNDAGGLDPVKCVAVCPAGLFPSAPLPNGTFFLYPGAKTCMPDWKKLLGLTDAQAVKLQQAMKLNETQADPLIDAVEKNLKKTALNLSSHASQSVMKADADSLAKLMTALDKVNVKYQYSLNSFLTPAQLAKFRQLTRVASHATPVPPSPSAPKN
jgi:Spy/CpxP family protein refolding chaperone